MAGSTFFERREGAASRPLGPRYSPRRPEKTLLHQVVCANLETLLAQAREQGDGAGLPAFVENEFRRYVDCGCLARGFIRVQCARCGHEEVAGFSCKCRGFCPSCIARRMDDTAAHLVDRVLPFAPYRQWVLSLPFRLRLRLARNDELLAAMRRVFVAAVGRWQRRKARGLGLRGARTALVCVTQRFDSLLRANPHFHALVPDAVFVEGEEGRVELRAVPKPSQEDVEGIVERIARRVRALLSRLDEDAEPEGALDRLRGQQLELLCQPPEPKPGRLSARAEGFSLHAARHLHAHDRAGLESLARYTLRPPVANSRLSRKDDGDLVLTLKRALPDGREQLTLRPMELMQRLAGLVPRPRVHQIHYFGAFASHGGLRARIVPRSPRRASWCPCPEEPAAGQLELPLKPRPVAVPALAGDAHEVVKAPAPRPRVLDWASLLARTFGDSLLECRCGGRRRIAAYVREPAKAEELLEQLGIPVHEPRFARARGPPQQELFEPSPVDAADPIYPDD